MQRSEENHSVQLFRNATRSKEVYRSQASLDIFLDSGENVEMGGRGCSHLHRGFMNRFLRMSHSVIQ